MDVRGAAVSPPAGLAEESRPVTPVRTRSESRDRSTDSPRSSTDESRERRPSPVQGLQERYGNQSIQAWMQQVADHSADTRTSDQAADRGTEREPLSLTQSLAVDLLTDAELVAEIRAIRRWLADQRMSTPQTHALRTTLGRLEATARERFEHSISLASFERLVRRTATVRLRHNVHALEAWKTYVESVVPEQSLLEMVQALEVDRMIDLGERRGLAEQATVDQWLQTPGPNRRWVQQKQVEGQYQACTGCHAITSADRLDRELADHRVEPLRSPLESIGAIETRPRRNEGPFGGIEPIEPLVNPRERAAFDPGTPSGMQASDRARETLRKLDSYEHIRVLGPDGYDVLPQEVLGSSAHATALVSEITAHIDRRQAALEQLAEDVTDPDFDYLLLEPIVRELLPLAGETVQSEVTAELERRAFWQTVRAVTLGVATAAMLVLVVFPPTTAAGTAGALTLGTALSAEQVYSGVQQYQEGQMIALGHGAHDVIAPEQQEDADTLLAMGIVNSVLGLAGIGGTIRSVQVYRSSRATSGTTRPPDRIEAQTADHSVEIRGLNTDSPQIRLVSSRGNVVHDGPATALSHPPRAGPAGSRSSVPARHRVEDILSEDGSQFYLPDRPHVGAELERLYQAGRARGMQADTRAAWANSVTRGRPRELLEDVLGPQYARQGNVASSLQTPTSKRVDTILTEDGTRFHLPDRPGTAAELERLYQAGRARGMQANTRAAWANSVTRGRPRELLEDVLGPQYARSGTTAMGGTQLGGRVGSTGTRTALETDGHSLIPSSALDEHLASQGIDALSVKHGTLYVANDADRWSGSVLEVALLLQNLVDHADTLVSPTVERLSTDASYSSETQRIVEAALSALADDRVVVAVTGVRVPPELLLPDDVVRSLEREGVEFIDLGR